MKILIVNSLYYPNIAGGAEIATQRLAEALIARGHKVVIATVNWRRRLEVTELNGVLVYYLPIANIYPPGRPTRRTMLAKLLWHMLDTYNPMMEAALGRILDKERPDVVSTHSVSGFSISAWRAVKRRGLGLVHKATGVDLLCPRAMLRAERTCRQLCGACCLYSRPRMLASQSVDVLTAASSYVIEAYSRHGGFRNAERMVIYNACKVSPLLVRQPRPRNGAIRFGFLGRLHRSKGVRLLVQSFFELPAGTAQLLIAGRGAKEYENSLKELTKNRSDIRWLGFVKPEELLPQIDVLVVPSVCQDNAPLAVLEGLQNGLPLIGSRRGGIPELMGEGTGWVFEPEESGALSRTMMLAMESRGDLPVMSERAIGRARLFSPEAMLDGYVAAYTRAIERNGGLRARNG